MADTDIITQVLGGVIPDLATLKLIGVIVVIGLVMIGVFIWLLTKWKRPIKYKADIFTKSGDNFFVQENVVIVFKRTALDQGYYIDKRKINLEIREGYLTKKARTKFYLMRIEDRYVAIKLKDAITLKLKGKEHKSVASGDFLATSQIDDYEKAITESVKLDAKKYRWVDKLGPIVQVVIPMIILIIAFFLVAWAARGNAAVTASNEAIAVENGKIASALARTATAFEMYAMQCGGSVVPPPG